MNRAGMLSSYSSGAIPGTALGWYPQVMVVFRDGRRGGAMEEERTSNIAIKQHQVIMDSTKFHMLLQFTTELYQWIEGSNPGR